MTSTPYRKGVKTKKNEPNDVCPRCEYALVPILERNDPRRVAIGGACPEPYCDYVQYDQASPPRLFIRRSHAS